MGAGTTVVAIGQWKEANRILSKAGPRYVIASRLAIDQEAEALVKEIKQNIKKGGVPKRALAASTFATRRLKGRGGRKPLIVTGDLMGSVAKTRVKADEVFAGILKTAGASAGGEQTANVADRLENGGAPIVVRITPQSRRFLMAAFRNSGLLRASSGGGGGSLQVAIIRTPKRPFMKPAFEKRSKNIDKRVSRKIGQLLKGDLGVV